MERERYDYREAIRLDIREWVSENYSMDSLRPQLTFYWEETLDKLEAQMRSAITGNDCGPYTCNAWQAEENLCHNLDLLNAACIDFDVIPDLSNPEACDVLIREYEWVFVFASTMDEIKICGL